MTKTVALGNIVSKIRSKNAGPFWVTIDLFFSDRQSYADAAADGAITASSVSELYGIPAQSIKIFRLDYLDAIKISYPRTTPQGSIQDRDIHAAQQYIPLLNLQIPAAGVQTKS